MRRSLSRMRTGTTAALLVGALLAFWPGVLLAASPTVGQDCPAGTGIAGTDEAGKVVIGESAGETACTLTFVAQWTNPPVCMAVNETNGGGYAMPIGVKTTRTTMQISSARPVVQGDVISYLCVGY
jgi:hypothetical protein